MWGTNAARETYTMPVDRLKRNIDWMVADQDGSIPSWERVSIAVLMDIRSELRTLNRLLACPNFIGIPVTLRSIRKNTAPKRKAAK